jgi:hypothetical protein
MESVSCIFYDGLRVLQNAFFFAFGRTETSETIEE